ncbi:type II toxin-antitoxin system VapC family toxin [Anabaena sp. UHCC 0451]|uniref:type II toxin-antitoxin system VapC family toxin n=1 Tax=Anabaena sp. UHCC 0451 TaxID=2055235 RepID=UPI002B21C267|nr:type II toxin-antitoxin system VapC family toxin [Anabaena sp. UHCC 0451]MEA5574811.1 type II toxin-antitoxin system VapC family toxin [Anabaena sp. UHCC 0451]
MQLLLDTQIIIWFVNDDPQLKDHLKDLIEDQNNTIDLSIASLWEMSIKYNLGKLKFESSYQEFVELEIIQSCLNLLDIKVNHFYVHSHLPLYHKDPFDRLIIAQSIAENIPLISVDSIFSQYPVTIIN